VSLVVAALGGNALIRRGQRPDESVQRTNLRTAAASLAQVADAHRLVITHGNGPQVGLLALQGEAYRDASPYSLDVLDAETEGMIGYLLTQELGAHLTPERLVALLTQVVVDPKDPAFDHPTKPIGPVYDRATAEARAAAGGGWPIVPDGEGWRRVVASPQPLDIVELPAIRILVEAGLVVTCVGGGGIPVVPAPGGGYRGVEAVIDKDLATALLAQRLGADVLVMLTDVDAVYDGWGTPAARRVERATVAEARAMDLPAGSMAPKVEAACRFVEAGGRYAVIGNLDDALALAAGAAGTIVHAQPPGA
jgi:carbamate kinase